MPKLSLYDRRKIAVMNDQGLGKTKIAVALGVSRPTVDKWLKLHMEEGESVFDVEKSSKPHHSPQKVDQKLWRGIVLLAWRHPAKGLQWFWENTGRQTSKTTIHNILKQLGLGSKGIRLGKVIRGNIKSPHALASLPKVAKQFQHLQNCYNQRNQFAEKPQTEFICIEMNQRLRWSNKKFHFTFFIDTYDMTAQVVIDDSQYINEYHYLETHTAIDQNNLPSFLNHKLLPEILTWHKFLRNENVTLKYIKFSYIQKEYPSHFSVLAAQLEPLSIPIAVEPRKSMNAIPWIRSFLDQFKIFQSETLNIRLIGSRYDRRDRRLRHCTDLVDGFLQRYNSTAIEMFPFLGESPHRYRKSVITKRVRTRNVSTIEQLGQSRDKTQPLLRKPSLETILTNSLKVNV